MTDAVNWRSPDLKRVCRPMRMLLVVAISVFLVSDPAWAASYFSPPALRLVPYQYFTPPVGAGPQASRRPVNVQIPKPENTTIGEEYAKGDIVIVNHERKRIL